MTFLGEQDKQKNIQVQQKESASQLTLNCWVSSAMHSPLSLPSFFIRFAILHVCPKNANLSCSGNRRLPQNRLLR
jgi:hypothetical protein